ncbi:ABC transporter ATP-binding protein [Paenibacillus sp. 32O-W]|uniref:ABC transporter ATP-binding protein n=1 Tax=Paenibacillus sp. 32O-W TaxID=1695218 RepID=UPI0011A3359A|nr:ABC transporter ATP-binding protein [Paenibacillus sp. 32O-W]
MLKKCLLHLKWWVVLYLFIGFAIQFLSSSGIVVFQQILDKAVAAKHIDEVTGLIAVYGILLGSTVILNYLDEYPSTHISNSLTERLKIMALSKISRIDYQAYQDLGTGQMIKVIENGAIAGSGILFSFLLRTMHELLPTIMFSLVFISFYDLRIMLVIAGGYVVIFLITHLLLKYLYKMKSTILKEQEKLSRYSVRGFMELVVFRTNKRYGKEIDKLSQTARSIINTSTRLKMIHEAFFAIFEWFITVVKIVVLVYGIQGALAGDTSLGVVVALLLFIEKIYSPIAIFNVLFVDYKLNRVAYQRLEDFINAPEDKNLEAGKEAADIQGKIEFRKVSFDYGKVKALSNVSFSIEAGTSVALVGLSGSGKSTMIKLIAGLLKKEEGQILIDGTDIDDLSLNSYYDHISYLSQDTPIFDTSIWGNIVFDQAISDEEIYAVLEKVHLKETVLKLPGQLDAWVGERGVKLSGGERQRLAFARILMQRRNVLILDEPVSALDNLTEANLMETVLNEFRNKTVIIIAHRLNSIKEVDKIIVLEKGSVIGEGKFDYLMDHCGAFKELWHKKASIEAISE